jgi:hypothetical protein
MKRRRTFRMAGYFRDPVEALAQIAHGYTLFFARRVKNPQWLRHLQLQFIVHACRRGLIRRAEVTEGFRLRRERFCWGCMRRRMPTDLCSGKTTGNDSLPCGAERGW